MMAFAAFADAATTLAELTTAGSFSFLGKLAYIEVAIYGHNFCTGVYCAAKRLLHNIIRFSFLAVFAHLMIFMGKIATVAGSVYICFVIMTIIRQEDAESLGARPPPALARLRYSLALAIARTHSHGALSHACVRFRPPSRATDSLRYRGLPGHHAGHVCL